MPRPNPTPPEASDAPADERPRRTRITFCITELDDGGAERALVQIATRLQAGGPVDAAGRDALAPHEVAVVCLGPEGPLAGPLREAGVAVDCLGWQSPADLRKLNRLRNALLSQRPDAVVSFLFHANVASRVALLRSGVPVLASHRVAEHGAGWHLRLERLTAHSAATHLAVSEGVADRLAAAGVAQRERIVVIPNGVDFARYAEAEPRPAAWSDAAVRMLAVGRLHRQKGFDRLIATLAAIAERQAAKGPPPPRPLFDLLIAGDGPERADLERQATAIDARFGRVQLPGRQSDLPGLYRAADLFVLSSRWEGMPNVLLEAAAAGCPIVATPAEGVRAILGNEATLLSHPDDENPPTSRNGADWIERLSALLTQPTVLDAEQEAALQTQRIVRERFTWDTAARGYADAIANAVLRSGNERDRRVGR